MKINSNTIKLEKESYEQLETIVKKVAEENKIENVSGIEIKLSKETGVVKFSLEDETTLDGWPRGIDKYYIAGISREYQDNVEQLLDSYNIDYQFFIPFMHVDDGTYTLKLKGKEDADKVITILEENNINYKNIQNHK